MDFDICMCVCVSGMLMYVQLFNTLPTLSFNDIILTTHSVFCPQNSGPLKVHQTQMASMSVEEINLAMKGRATMMAAVSCVTVPKISINVGNCHGDDNYTMVRLLWSNCRVIVIVCISEVLSLMEAA